MTRTGLIKYKYAFFASVVFLSLIPSKVMALAGIGEHDTTFHYNSYAKVSWQHPGEFCIRDVETSDRKCLMLIGKSDEDFSGLESSLEEINVPLNESTPYIIARRSSGSKWLVYDLEKEHHLINGVTYNEALAVWQSLGLPEPAFIDSIDPAKFLRETAASQKRRLTIRLFPFAIVGFVPGMILFVFLGCMANTRYRKYKKEGTKKSLFHARLLMILTGLTGLWVMASIGFFWYI
jgi:hypothetical protein